ncbi:MAG: hypothetical protein JXB85_07870 [Anaerolineales bacterium]|nr:hypothetical protein [Anaerolineales bacterium]
MTEALPLLTGPQKPGKIQAVAILTLISGITNILWMLLLYMITSLGTAFIGCLALPFFVPPIVLGVFEIVFASKLLATPMKTNQPSPAIAIMEIICILTGNLVAVAAGIVALVVYNDPEVKDYFAQANAPSQEIY